METKAVRLSGLVSAYGRLSIAICCPSRVFILTLQSICNAGTFPDAHLLEIHKESTPK